MSGTTLKRSGEKHLPLGVKTRFLVHRIHTCFNSMSYETTSSSCLDELTLAHLSTMLHANCHKSLKDEKKTNGIVTQKAWILNDLTEAIAPGVNQRKHHEDQSYKKANVIICVSLFSCCLMFNTFFIHFQDKCLKDRAVRFRSTDEEFVFEIEPNEKIVIPDGSDIFQKILKDMQAGIENNSTAAEDDDVFDGVFTASIGRLEKKTEVKKCTITRKSILKRRGSCRK